MYVPFSEKRQGYEANSLHHRNLGRVFPELKVPLFLNPLSSFSSPRALWQCLSAGTSPGSFYCPSSYFCFCPCIFCLQTIRIKTKPLEHTKVTLVMQMLPSKDNLRNRREYLQITYVIRDTGIQNIKNNSCHSIIKG